MKIQVVYESWTTLNPARRQDSLCFINDDTHDIHFNWVIQAMTIRAKNGPYQREIIPMSRIYSILEDE